MRNGAAQDIRVRPQYVELRTAGLWLYYMRRGSSNTLILAVHAPPLTVITANSPPAVEVLLLMFLETSVMFGSALPSAVFIRLWTAPLEEPRSWTLLRTNAKRG